MGESPFFWLDYRDACAAGGCVVCAHNDRATRRYLANLLYENVLDVELRAALVAARGFCAAHARLLAEVALAEAGGRLGVATLYETVVHRLEADLRGALNGLSLPQPRRRPGHKIAAALKAHGVCPACRVLDESEQTFAHGLTQVVAAPGEGRTLFQSSEGLCLPHLRQCLQLAETKTAVRFLLEATAAKLASLHRDLVEYGRKHDYRFAKEPKTEGEITAWRRALHLLGAGPQTAPPPRKE
jgi:hypothetical protein